jgi:hypothetical protein
MERGELRQALRDRLDDNNVPPLWSDEEYNRALSEGVQQACIRARLLRESVDPELTRIELIEGQSLYTLHPQVLAISTAGLLVAKRPCELTTQRQMDRDFPGYQVRGIEAGSRDTYLVLDEQKGHVRVWPTPGAPADPLQPETLVLSVWRLPTEQESMDTDSDEPAVPVHQHIDLLDWAEHLLYLKADAETRDIGRSNEAASRFAAKFGELPTWRQIQLWGHSPRRGGRARFV